MKQINYKNDFQCLKKYSLGYILCRIVNTYPSSVIMNRLL